MPNPPASINIAGGITWVNEHATIPAKVFEKPWNRMLSNKERDRYRAANAPRPDMNDVINMVDAIEAFR